MGNSGIGKTYFCSAVIHWIYGKVSSYRYWKESNLFQEVRSVISSGSGDYIRKLDSLTDDEFVMIDDMGSSGVNEWRKEVLLHLIDGRYESLKPTIFTSNLTRQEIFRDLGSRSESRLFSKENLVLEIHNGEDIRQRETK